MTMIAIMPHTERKIQAAQYELYDLFRSHGGVKWVVGKGVD